MLYFTLDSLLFPKSLITIRFKTFEGNTYILLCPAPTQQIKRAEKTHLINDVSPLSHGIKSQCRLLISLLKLKPATAVGSGSTEGFLLKGSFSLSVEVAVEK